MKLIHMYFIIIRYTHVLYYNKISKSCKINIANKILTSSFVY